MNDDDDDDDDDDDHNDLSLVQRIVHNNPSYLENPDYHDKSNTSLHLAAQAGYFAIAQFLVSFRLTLEHQTHAAEGVLFNHADHVGILYNTDHQTPLHLAAAFSHAKIVDLLCISEPDMLDKRDKSGYAALHLASRGQSKSSESAVKMTTKPPEDTSTIQVLIDHGADVHIQDGKGDTCLHHASAFGNLKAIRALIQAGADPLAQNKAGWTPEYYSLTVQAEVYYRNLVAEWERRKAEENMRRKERKAIPGGGVRLVNTDDSHDYETESDEARSQTDGGRSRATSGGSGGLGITIGPG